MGRDSRGARPHHPNIDVNAGKMVAQRATRRSGAAASDSFGVILGDERGTRAEPFVSPEGAELPPEVAALGTSREDDYRANPMNPPDGAAPFRARRG